MNFVTLILFSISCSFAFGDTVGYDQLKADDAINDDVNDNDQLSGGDDRNDGIADDNDELDRTVAAIKQVSEVNEGVDDSDNDNYGHIDKKLSAENIGTDNSKAAVLDASDNEGPHQQSVAHLDGSKNDGNTGIADNDESVLVASPNEQPEPPPISFKNDGNTGIADNDESVLDANDNENPHEQSEPPLIGSKNDGNIGIADNDETILDASDKQMNNHIKTSKLSNLNLGNDELDVKQYQLELAAGDLSELLSNAHHQEPNYYKDLSRRFVPIYPYEKKKVKKHRISNPEDIIRFLLSHKKSLRDNQDRDIVPIKAPPELVLAVMKNGTKKYASKPSEPTEEVIRQYMLRSGDYWNNVWKEEVAPSSPLRTKKQHKKSSDSPPITAKLVPGTKLYELLAGIVKKTPKLVYIINK